MRYVISRSGEVSSQTAIYCLLTYLLTICQSVQCPMPSQDLITHMPSISPVTSVAPPHFTLLHGCTYCRAVSASASQVVQSTVHCVQAYHDATLYINESSWCYAAERLDRHVQ